MAAGSALGVLAAMFAAAVSRATLVHVAALLLVGVQDVAREALAVERSDGIAAVVMAPTILHQALVHICRVEEP